MPDALDKSTMPPVAQTTSRGDPSKGNGGRESLPSPVSSRPESGSASRRLLRPSHLDLPRPPLPLTASPCIGPTGGCSAHRPALGRALGGRDVLALRGLGLRLSLLLALIAL